MKAWLLPRSIAVSALIVAVGVSSVVSAATDRSAATQVHTGFTPDTIAVDGSVEIQGFCDALVEFESAQSSEDPELIETAIDDLSAFAPDDVISAAVQQMLANIEGGPFDPGYIEAHTELIDQVWAECNYVEVPVEAYEYEFGVLPNEVDRGRTVFVFTNYDGMHHQLWIGHIPEDADIEEILRLPEEERNEYKVTQTIAGPTETSKAGPVELVTGRYVAACFMPEDASSEMVAEIIDTGTIPYDAGGRHWELGMLQEFYVT